MLEAKDGAEGIDRALETIPDLVISDVMMPHKNGYEVCEALKTDEKTSHIPIILLTAKAAEEEKIAGLETGADDYVLKPFRYKELLVRVKNLIELRRKLRERFSGQLVLKPKEISVTSRDAAFLERVLAVIEEHMADEDFYLSHSTVDLRAEDDRLRKLRAYRKGNSTHTIFHSFQRLEGRLKACIQLGCGNVLHASFARRGGERDPSFL